jgi:hypothetical protein
MTAVKRQAISKVCSKCLVKLTAKNKSNKERFICTNCAEQQKQPQPTKNWVQNILAKLTGKFTNQAEGNK